MTSGAPGGGNGAGSGDGTSDCGWRPLRRFSTYWLLDDGRLWPTDREKLLNATVIHVTQFLRKAMNDGVQWGMRGTAEDVKRKIVNFAD